MTEEPPVPALEVPEALAGSREAIEANLERLRRAELANDVAGVVGVCKDLAECVCKVVVDALGGTYGSDVKLPKLAGLALDVLGIHPAGLQSRPPLQRISQSFIGTIQSVSELRSTDGTGHGRSQETDLHPDHAKLVARLILPWCGWLLSASDRVVRARQAVLEKVAMIHSQVFYRGDMRALVDKLDVENLGDTLQHTVGVAIARRFWVRGTVVPHLDIIEPMTRGELRYPEAFTAGIVEGLMLEYSGYVRTGPARIADIRSIVSHLPVDVARDVLERLSTAISEAASSYAFDDEAKQETLLALRDWRQNETDERLREVVERIELSVQAL